MLLQAYDFLYLYDHYGCQLQMGASDQWGNITMGVELIRKVRGGTAWALTSPLVLKADGTKFGKSESGALYLSPDKTSPFELYQYFVRCEDEMVGRYLRFFTFLSHEEILSLDDATTTRPQKRAAQRALAHEVCVLVHGEDETTRVERAVEALYSEDIAHLDASTLLQVVGDAPSTNLSSDALAGDGLDLVDVLVTTGLSPSRNVARTTVAQGGVYINNRRVDGERPVLRSEDVIAGGYVLLRRGRQQLHLLCFA
jgi:tyrosyl-tRNA synthetase